MTALEARALAEKRAPEVAKQLAEQQERIAARAREEAETKHKNWRIKLASRLRSLIEFEAKVGKTETTYSLATGFTSGLEDFLSKFEFKEDIPLVLTPLTQDGYMVKLTTESYEVDETSAYFNSGGECGSKSPYWTTDVVISIGW